MFELDSMSPSGQLLYKAYFISVRIVTGVFAYIYPSYVTLCRVLKWQSKPSKQTLLQLQTVANYWIVQLLVSGLYIALADLFKPILFEELFRLAFSYYLVQNNFANAELLYRGIFSMFLSNKVSLLDMVTPKVVSELQLKTPKFQTKTKTGIQSQSSAFGEQSGYRPVIE